MEALDPQEVFEFKAWLRTHRRKFRDYTLDELIELALAVGFSKRCIYQEVLEGKRDIDTFSTVALRTWYHVQREWDYIELGTRLYLPEKWERLVDWYTDKVEIREVNQ